MTTFKRFMDEIENEASQEGQEASDQLEALRRCFEKRRITIEEEKRQQPCLIDKFFESQRNLPPERQRRYAHISCPCPRCKPGKL